MTKAKDLKKGDQFRLDGQKKFRTFEKSTTLENSPIVHHRDKLLIVTDDCKHFFALPDDEVQVKTC